MNVTQIANARLPGSEAEWSLSIANERLSAIEPQSSRMEPRPGGIDAAGGLVTTRFVDAHVHLDLAYSLDQVEENQSGTLLEAIGHWTAAKRHMQPDDIRERAIRAIHAEAAAGTGLIRSHVDVASNAGMRLAEGVIAARDATCHLCSIQLVAFPQDGLIRDPGAADLVRQSVRAGVDLVGGIPHIERTQRDGLAHLEKVFELAEELDADIDVHIDETDDPASRYTEHLAAMTIERGWQGRVTASHVCALSSYDEVHAQRVMDLIAEADLHVVTNPGVNLHLQGRFDRYPRRRGLTRVRDLLARGVTCGAGQDCIRDPFYPLGNGSMLDQVFLLIHAEHMSTPELILRAFGMIGAMGAAALRVGDNRLEVGAPANLLLHDAPDVHELVRLRPRPKRVLCGGRVLEIPELPEASAAHGMPVQEPSRPTRGG